MNFVIILSKIAAADPLGHRLVDPKLLDNVIIVKTKFMIPNRTEA